jgi:hypothetical protein
VDSTFHHFFNINLTGDRYLEDDNLGPAHEQKKYGFFVPDGAGGRTPNDAYRMVMWYFRNIVYWLIPANRITEIGWSSLSEAAHSTQAREELASSTRVEMANYQLSHYLYYGQLAERYLKRARGACAVLDIHRIFYEPKIPWWEWIQNMVDVWDPVQIRDEEGLREQLVGVLGLGPQHQLPATITLGAALVTTARVQQQLAGRDQTRLAEASQQEFTTVLRHAASKLTDHLQTGARTQRRLESVASQPLTARTR